MSKSEDDGYGEGDGGEKGLCASEGAGCNAAPVFQSVEHDRDQVATPITSSVVADCLAVRLLTGDAEEYPLVFRRVPEQADVNSPVSEHPFGSRQTAYKSSSAGVVAVFVILTEK